MKIELPSKESVVKVLLDKSKKILEKSAMEEADKVQEFKTELPPFTQETLTHIDSTPDAEYPLRILRAQRSNCDCHFEVTGVGAKSKVLWDMLNSHQDQRAKILDKALEILTRYSNELLGVAKDAG
jgi:hypothetical protein